MVPTASASPRPLASAAPVPPAEDPALDLVIVVDLSDSMRAEIGPATTRLEATQTALDELLPQLTVARAGIVVYGRQAQTLLPLTTDLAAARHQLARLGHGVVDGAETATGEGLAQAARLLVRSEAICRSVLLVTDGDSNAGAISPEGAADLLASMRVRLFVVAIGSEGPATVDLGRDLFGRPLRTRRLLPFDPDRLRPLVEATGGQLYVARDPESMVQAVRQLADELCSSTTQR